MLHILLCATIIYPTPPSCVATTTSSPSITTYCDASHTLLSRMLSTLPSILRHASFTLPRSTPSSTAMLSRCANLYDSGVARPSISASAPSISWLDTRPPPPVYHYAKPSSTPSTPQHHDSTSIVAQPMQSSKTISNIHHPSEGRVEGNRPSMHNPQQATGAIKKTIAHTLPSEGRVEGNRPSMHNPQQATGAVGGTTTPTPFFLPCPQG